MDGLRVYVAGAMESAGGNWNMPLFDFVTQKLREAGCEVFNPAEHIREKHGSLENVLKLSKADGRRARRQAIRDEILWIMDNAQLLVMLPGWERSSGATAERAVALSINIEVREIEKVLLPTGKMHLDPVPALY